MKGIAWQAVLPLVLLVIVFAVIVPKMLEASTKSSSSICGYLGNCNTLAAIEKGDELEKAVKCAADRCFKGCNDIETQAITWLGGVSCSQFCQKEFQDDKGKICGERAKAHPVVFKSGEHVGAIIQAADMKDYVQCLAPAPVEACGKDSIGWTKQVISTSGRPVLYIDESLVRSSPQTAGAGILPGHRTCVGRLESTKTLEVIGTVALTVVAPEATFIKLSAKTAQTASKLEKIKRLYTAGKIGVAGTGVGTGAVLSELFWQQVRIIKSVDLKPSVIYIWANDAEKGVGGFFKKYFVNPLTSFTTGTASHLVLCSQLPPSCNGKIIACEDRKDETGKYIKDLCEAGSGCKWDKDKCIQEEQSKVCEFIIDKGTCSSQPGCCWGDDCKVFTFATLSKSVYGRIVQENEPEYTELKAFFDAVNAIGGKDAALNVWGLGMIKNIRDLFDFPEFAHIEKWSDFTLCKNNNVESLPGDCAIIDGKSKYCKVKDKKFDYVDHPFECGCPEGEGTKVDEGGINKQCQKFDATKIKDVIVERGYVNLDEKYNVVDTVAIGGKDYQIVTATLHDSNDIVVTGISPEYVKFTTTFGSLEVTSCEKSGTAKYYSCNVKITSTTLGKATVTFVYTDPITKKEFTGSTDVEFVNP